jgi:hypothetical protein
MSANFKAVHDLIAAAVADSRGDALLAEVKIRKRLDAEPDLRAAVTDTLVIQGIRRIAQDIEGDYPKDETIAF